jgi:hypothetical protein
VQPFTIDDGYDLALCLEVAEHLPERAAAPLVTQLTKAAPIVLFSAAIPGQGGHGHVNEQPHKYWHRLFASHQFVTIDCIRPRVWQNPQVAYWYRQNVFVYASQAALDKYPALKAEYLRPTATDMEILHQEVLYNRTVAARVMRYLPAPILKQLAALRGKPTTSGS